MIKPKVCSLKWVTKYLRLGQEKKKLIIKNEKENLTISKAKIKQIGGVFTLNVNGIMLQSKNMV